MTFQVGDRVRYIYLTDSVFWMEEGVVTEVGLASSGPDTSQSCVRVKFDKQEGVFMEANNKSTIILRSGQKLLERTLIKIEEKYYLDDLL